MTHAPASERLLATRHSCRAFLPDRFPQPTFDGIRALAQRTASWCNAQPWQVIVASGAATDRFRDALAQPAPAVPDLPFPEDYPDEYSMRRRECGLQLYDAVGVAHGDRAASGAQAARNFVLFDAPHVAIVTSRRELGVYGAVDCGAYVGTFLLAAQAHGVAAIPQAALAARSPTVRAHFAIPDARVIVCVISFGYEDRSDPANAFRTRRAPHGDNATITRD